MDLLELPFKPFTLSEAKDIAGCDTKWLDYWVKHQLEWFRGEDGTQGLSYMAVVAVFVGSKWLEAGAPRSAANSVVAWLSRQAKSDMDMAVEDGFDFAIPPVMGRPGFVRPPRSKLGRELNLRKLLPEFLERMRRVFPDAR